MNRIHTKFSLGTGGRLQATPCPLHKRVTKGLDAMREHHSPGPTCWYHTIRPEGASDTEDLRSGRGIPWIPGIPPVTHCLLCPSLIRFSPFSFRSTVGNPGRANLFDRGSRKRVAGGGGQMRSEDNLESLFACSSPRVTISMFSQSVFGKGPFFSKPREHTPLSPPAAQQQAPSQQPFLLEFRGR